MEKDPFTDAIGTLKRGQIVTVTITNLQDSGVDVEFNGVTSFIRRSDLSRDRAEQRSDKFVVGDKVDARITNIDKSGRKVSFSIKAKEIAEEKEAVQQYGSSDSGASLGDILGAALNKGDKIYHLSGLSLIGVLLFLLFSKLAYRWNHGVSCKQVT